MLEQIYNNNQKLLMKSKFFIGIFILFLASATSYPSSYWIDRYTIKSDCSRLMCKFCPIDDSTLVIDRNTGNMKDDNFILRVNASSLLSQKLENIEFELEEDSDSVNMNLFEYKYNVALGSDGIQFFSEENDKCSFFAERIKPNHSYYDVVLDIESMLELLYKGWKVNFHNMMDYTVKALRDTFLIGVAGPFNTGKTWMTSKLAQKEFLVGYDVHTKGLSLKFAEYLNRGATFLDTAGFDTPMTFYKDSDKEFMEIFSKNMTVDEAKELKLKDRHITEHFLQNFILEQSDCILIVVGKLTFSDQKLINRILKQYGNSPSKDIIIVHNYHQMTEVIQVHQSIEEDIKGAFNVKRAPIEINEEEGKFYNREVYINLDYRAVRHVVTAREGTRAGDYFNPPVFHLMKSLVHSRTPREPFDIVKIMAEYVKNNLKNYAILPEKKVPIVEMNEQTNTMIMRNIQSHELRLKPIAFDMNGHLKPQTYDILQNYDYYLNPKENKLIFRVDIPGVKMNADGRREVAYSWDIGEKSCLIVDVELEDKHEFNSKDFMVLADGRRQGKHRFNPPCIDHQYKITNERHINSSFVDGVLTLYYGIEDKSFGIHPVF